jgi:hypothetical protein
MMVSCSARVMRGLSFSGNVTSATMAKSTGNALLDKITTDTFGRTSSARLWYGEPDAVTNAIRYAKFRSRSHNAVIRVYDEAGNVIDTHEHAGDFKEP